MRLVFLGATHEVTGSCTYMEVGGTRLLIDCGMEQGPDWYENQPVPVNPGELDFVLLTHAHIDHSGKLPLLYKNGFRGKIYATKATCQLASIMLRDSAHIQMFEAEWKNRKGKRKGESEVLPLYDINDAEGAIQKLTPLGYNERIELCENISVRFVDVGHLLGSASIEVWAGENGESRKIVFSGDIGNPHQPLLKDPHYITEADYAVMESTYGDREHSDTIPDYVGELTSIIQRTFDRGGNVVIPSFAVGRTQELLYFIRQIKGENRIRGHEGFEVYVDSPLANEATEVFMKNVQECLDADTLALVSKGINPIGFPGLRTSVTSDDSKAINFDTKPKVIISASGMCDAGRIKHHLKHNLWREECTVLFVGYQAVGSPGRAILDGVKKIKLFGEDIEIHADICSLQGISGHADHSGLIKWISNVEKMRGVFVLHGDPDVTEVFTNELKNSLKLPAMAPYSGADFDLVNGSWSYEAPPKLAAKKQRPQGGDIFSRLTMAGERLMAVIRKNKGGTNKDLAKFADQIDSISEKWDK